MHARAGRVLFMAVALGACGGGRAPASGGTGVGAAGSGSGAASGDLITMTQAPHELYEETLWQRDQATTVTFTDGGSPAKLEEAQQHECSIGTLELADGTPSRIVVMYPLQHIAVVDGVGPPLVDTALQGNTYVLKLDTDGELLGSRTDRAEMTPAEQARLQAHHVRLGQPSSMLSLWASRGWRVGEPYALTSGELARHLNHPNDPGKVIAMTTTLTLVEPTQLTFESVGRVVHNSDGGNDLTIDWTSKVLVAREGMREMLGTGTATGLGKFRGRAVKVALTQTERVMRMPPAAPGAAGSGSGSGSAAPPAAGPP